MNSPDPRLSTFRPATILLIKPGSLGDVVHALPTIAALRDAHPQAHLTWVVDPRWAPILEGTGIADELLEFPREQFRGLGGKIKALAWYRALRDRQPDLAIDLQGLLRSALIARASGARKILGLSDAREGARHLYIHTADTTPTTHAVDRYLQILPALALPIPTLKRFPLPQPTNHQSPDATHAQLILHPFARGAAKSLSAEAVRRLLSQLAPTRVTLVGIGPALPDLPPNVTDLTNRTTLVELIALLRHAAAVISVDSGPMHLAAALDVPLLAIHTWSDPRKVGPYGENAWIHQGGQLRPQSLTLSPLPPKPLTEADLEAIADWSQSTMAGKTARR